MVANGVLESSGQTYRFTRDYTFSSPSHAASVIRGGSANGRHAWKNSEGKRLKEVQQESIGEN
ncbi:MAG: DUF4357 domain-containing protein [Planctomycetaceae bacterium]|nr:DUF4357 domain-containing protein [Planctomycetaceae bacterium]